MTSAAATGCARASQSRGLRPVCQGKARMRTAQMRLALAAVVHQQGAAEPRDRVSGCSKALQGGLR